MVGILSSPFASQDSSGFLLNPKKDHLGLGNKLAERSDAWLASYNICRADDYLKFCNYVHLEAVSYGKARERQFVAVFIPFVSGELARALNEKAVRVQNHVGGVECYAEYPLMFIGRSNSTKRPDDIIPSVVWLEGSDIGAEAVVNTRTDLFDPVIKIVGAATKRKVNSFCGLSAKAQSGVAYGLVKNMARIYDDGRDERAYFSGDSALQSEFDEFLASLVVSLSDNFVTASFRKSATQKFKLRKVFLGAFEQ